MSAASGADVDPAAAPRRPLRRRVVGWPGWALLAVVTITLLTIGSTRTSGPRSQEDRVDDLTQRIACPVCDGESVFVSQNNASRALRSQVADLVRANELSDDEILAVIDSRNEAELLLVPRSSGLDALVWVLPAVGAAVGATGLALAFRRWRLDAASTAGPTDADRELVAAALAAEGLARTAAPVGVPTSGDPDRWPDPAEVADRAEAADRDVADPEAVDDPPTDDER